ncbi:hypothetical protein COV13_00400 [Candidatus Woesearchaeota archaeon CG10_big_fil_rev_8_21_14_0_10_32_9]|nr:MAG: hypothetical protein COV13_00400 [Candidatus Woesearchaeota archaeon CG10_big_fil_rev_8_21_14_0_10_32_9]
MFKNKTVVITGGSNGLGYALGKLLSELGANVTSLDIVVPKEKIKGVNYSICNIINSSQIKKAMNNLKKIDLLICNAGVMARGNLFEVSEEEYDLLMNVNVKGPWLTLKTSHEKLSSKSVVLFISSRHGAYLNPNPAIYSLSKSALIDMATLLRKTKNVGVKVAALGPFDTAVSRHGVSKSDLKKKLKIMKSPEEIAHLLLSFVLSDQDNLMYDQEKNKYFYA